MYVHDIIRMAGNKYDDRPAVVAGDHTMTFGELRDASWRLANALRSRAQSGDRVAILAENLPEYVQAYYGVPAAGMALTFLNYRLHPREWVWIINNASARILIVQSSFHETIRPHLDELATVEEIIHLDDGRTPCPPGTRYDELLASASDCEPPADMTERSTAWLLYTSGTTGFPKGAMLSHRNVVAAALNTAVEQEPQPDERSLIAFPLCHIAGYTVLVTHLRGGRVVVPPAFEPESWMALVDEHGITGTALAPTMLNMLLQHPKIDEYRLDSLQGIGYGASAMPVEVLRSALRRFGPVVQSGFGMTELAGNVLSFSKASHERAVAGEEHLLASCGVPMSLAEVRVVGEDFEECAPGEVGEIIVRGDQVLEGYFENPEATAAAFVGPWFRTGDMAYRDAEGFFYIVDRRKDMIISGGENVYSREVEEVLYLHPAVSEAAVIGLPDPTWGERVAAVVVVRAGMSATADEIIDVVRDRLAGYKRPKEVIFVDELPKTVSGKILKRSLRETLSRDTDARDDDGSGGAD